MIECTDAGYFEMHMDPWFHIRIPEIYAFPNSRPLYILSYVHIKTNIFDVFEFTRMPRVIVV